MNNSKKIIKEQGIKKPDKKAEKVEQKTRKNLILIIIGALVILGGVFVVCYTQLRPRAILTVEGPGADGDNSKNTVYYTDAMVDIYKMESMYNAYGMDWEGGEDESLSDTVKSQIMDSIKEREILYMQAQKAGLTLTEDEQKEVDTTVQETVSGLSDEAKKVKGLSESNIREQAEKQKLADKEKQAIIDGFDINDDSIRAQVNKNDYHQYTLQYYTISKKEEAKDTDSTDTESTPAQKSPAVLKKDKENMEALRTKALTADDFTKLITDSDNDQKDDTTGISYATENLLESDAEFADEAVRKAVKEMKNDEISKVMETDSAYYVFKMVNNDDPQAYEDQVKSKITSEENTQFNKYMDETLKKQYTFKVEEYWRNRVTIGGITA